VFTFCSFPGAELQKVNIEGDSLVYLGIQDDNVFRDSHSGASRNLRVRCAEDDVELAPVRLILIRHGQTMANTTHTLDTAPPGPPLSDAGRAQAEALAAELAGEPIEAIWVSNTLRTHETAAPLAAATGLTPVEHAGLLEVQAGDYEGAAYMPYLMTLSAWATDPTTPMPGAENGLEFFARFDGAIRALTAEGHACAAAFSHGGALRIWLQATFGPALPVDPATAWFFDNTSYAVLDNASGAWEIVRWPDRCLVDTEDGPVPLAEYTARHAQPKKTKQKKK
jgi:probable phosphoglycerate mutase